MKATLYMPYYDYNDKGFDVDDAYYNDEAYVKAMESEYAKSKDLVYNSVMNAKNGTGTLVQGTDGKTYVFGEKVAQNEDKVAYTQCGAILYGDDGNEENVDKLISSFVDGKPFVEMVEFDEATSEEEFISEVSLWVKEHNAINKYKEYKGEEWTWAKEPKRNVKIKFLNKADEELTAMLDGCKILDIADGSTVVLYIEKIRLIDDN